MFLLHNFPSFGFPLYGVDLFHAVGGMCQNSGASMMAKSLFASSPHQTPKMTVVGQQLKDDVVTGVGDNLHKIVNIKGNFHEFHEAFSSHINSKIKIGLHMS